MACYTPWFVYLQPGSPEYERTRKETEAKFLALKHIIDNYFAAFRKEMANAKYAGNGSQYETATGQDPFDDDNYDAICRHMACDGLHQDDLYDAESILNRETPASCNYAYVLMQCAWRLRSTGWKYRFSPKANREGLDGSQERLWFAEVPH